MGEHVTFPSNGDEGQGHLAVPESGSGIGVVVIQEWWGLNEQICDVCDRFAAEGFVTLAPDLYRGAEASEPDEAGKLMMAMSLEQAGKDMSGAVDFLAGHDAVTGDGLGVVGFCMGGGLALILATQRPDRVRACAPFYGLIPWPSAQPDWSRLSGPVQGHYASDDAFAGPELVGSLEQDIRDAGGEVEIFVYPGTEHAFANHHNAEVHKPAETEQAYQRTFELFRSRLA